MAVVNHGRFRTEFPLAEVSTTTYKIPTGQELLYYQSAGGCIDGFYGEDVLRGEVLYRHPTILYAVGLSAAVTPFLYLLGRRSVAGHLTNFLQRCAVC